MDKLTLFILYNISPSCNKILLPVAKNKALIYVLTSMWGLHRCAVYVFLVY